eukprot:5604497-Pleurochrysis_carterae.AAC.1
MSPAQDHYTTQLRTFSYWASIIPSTCVDAAASARAHMLQLCVLLLAVFIVILTGWFSRLPAITPRALAHVFESYASAAAPASAIALTFALVGHTEVLTICTFTTPILAAARISCSLLSPASSRIMIIAAIVT